MKQSFNIKSTQVIFNLISGILAMGLFTLCGVVHGKNIGSKTVSKGALAKVTSQYKIKFGSANEDYSIKINRCVKNVEHIRSQSLSFTTDDVLMNEIELFTAAVGSKAILNAQGKSPNSFNNKAKQFNAQVDIIRDQIKYDISNLRAILNYRPENLKQFLKTLQTSVKKLLVGKSNYNRWFNDFKEAIKTIPKFNPKLPLDDQIWETKADIENYLKYIEKELPNMTEEAKSNLEMSYNNRNQMRNNLFQKAVKMSGGAIVMSAASLIPLIPELKDRVRFEYIGQLYGIEKQLHPLTILNIDTNQKYYQTPKQICDVLKKSPLHQRLLEARVSEFYDLLQDKNGCQEQSENCLKRTVGFMTSRWEPAIDNEGTK
jgi:hypothetical protein